MGWEHNENLFPLCTLSILNGALAIGARAGVLGPKAWQVNSCTSDSTIENFTLYFVHHASLSFSLHVFRERVTNPTKEHTS
jgi:hypothetical protein